ncbi:uncharacterized protein MELLADRAFT_113218 [Melampsora larici-populina 98AG31]|uniref:Uncharacterized protein n=1 Tax=Melampsora larici-populina (strain 98AG31 / pathotype 3-4-7) TaxID=747676 RepID=F4S954_MELLP|nr:uncharacterized protein MELLADRAFT_113218 [Melampsora larici-populina 98AG31]EGF98824.1 hypothetical protein MELLADRAFT_113218 [Melampsora larici-populina 98AG31]
MSYLSLGLNLPARFGLDPWFVMKRAVALHSATVSCASSDNSQQNAYELLLISLCKSPKLITWDSTSTHQSEVSEEKSIESSPCVPLPTQRKRPVRRQRLPKILISDEDCTLDTALVHRVQSESNLINPTTSFIPLTEDQSENFHIFNDLLAEHNLSTISTPTLPTSKSSSIIPNSSRATKRSHSKSQLFATPAPVSKKSKSTPHWTEILDDLMTAADWEEAEEELKKESKPLVNTTSLNQTLSFIPLTEDESENFHIFNELLAEHQVSTNSTSSLSNSKLPSITHNSPVFTTQSPISKKPNPTLHWTEILDNLMTASDWEEAEEELRQEKTLKSSTSPLAITTSPSSLSTSTFSNSKPSKPSSKNLKDTKRQLHWSEILDNLMTDEDRQEVDESFTITLPFSHERSIESSTIDETYSLPSTPSSNNRSSYSSAENTHSLPTPVEELKDPFSLINNNYQNSYYHSDISFEIVKSSLEENDYFTTDLSFNIEKSLLNLDFDCENSFC